MSQTEQYKTIMMSEHKLLDLHLKETFQFRDITLLFAKRDFTVKYKQKVPGPAWALIRLHRAHVHGHDLRAETWKKTC